MLILDDFHGMYMERKSDCVYSVYSNGLVCSEVFSKGHMF